MNAISFNSESTTILNAVDCISPIPVIKLKWALKAEAHNAVVTIKTTDPNATRDLKDFCAATGNQYLGADEHDDFAMHYVKKVVRECAACSNARTVLMGFAAVGALAYSAPLVIAGDPAGLNTFVFLAALLSLPSLTVNHLLMIMGLFSSSKG